MTETIIEQEESVKMKTKKRPLHARFVSLGAFVLLTTVMLILLDMVISSLAGTLAISHASIGNLLTDGPVVQYITDIRIIAILCLLISTWSGLQGEKMYLHSQGGILQKILIVMISAVIAIMFGFGFGVLLIFGVFLWNPKQLVDWEAIKVTVYRVGVIGTILAFMLGELVLGIGIGVLSIFIIFFWNPMQVTDWKSRKVAAYIVGLIGIILAIVLGEYIIGIGIWVLLIFNFFFWNPKRFADWKSRNLTIYRVGFIGTILAFMFGEMVLALSIAFLLTFSIFFWNSMQLADRKSRKLITTLYTVGFIGIILAVIGCILSLDSIDILFINGTIIASDNIAMLGIDVGILLIFGLFFWNPKLVENWNSRNLTIYRAGFIGIITTVILGEMVLYGANIGVTLLKPFLGSPLSNYLTMEGAEIIALMPGFLVVPLYLIIPKVIRDIWNMRPNIETFWREFIYHPMGILGLIIIGTIVVIAVFAPVIAPYYWENPPGAPIILDELLQPPSPEHILGTNHRGQDIFSRIIYGSQISLLIGFAASIVAVFLGTTVGLLAGYYGGILDIILMRITDVFLCLPTLPLMLIFLVLFGQGLQNVIIVIAILGWTGTARMVRSEALSLREQPLTEAAHALGASDGYILIHHILPNTLPLILANMILGVVTAILSEAGIAFLGFVDIHGQPSWGIVLHWAWKNAALLANKWWWFIPPGVLIMLTTLGFVFISHTADKVVNPRLRGRRS